MPTWSGILSEISETRREDGSFNVDLVRRKYLALAHQETGRNIILYASKCTQGPIQNPDLITINDEDIQGLMEVVHGLSNEAVDLILHSPGGSIAATEAIVRYLRSKFNHIRVVVPQYAMSAATMIACAADKVLLGKHSFLGPTDPQLVFDTPLGRRMMPAFAIKDQFERAVAECADPTRLAAWLPILGQYGPDLLNRCDNTIKLAKELVRGWLREYMFKDHEDRIVKSRKLADWLTNHKKFKTHDRHITRDDLESKGFEIEKLEDNEILQDVFLSILHSTTLTFDKTSAVKIIENHEGKAHVKTFQQINIPVQIPSQMTPSQE